MNRRIWAAALVGAILTAGCEKPNLDETEGGYGQPGDTARVSASHRPAGPDTALQEVGAEHAEDTMP